MNQSPENLEDLVEQYTELVRTGQAPSPQHFAETHPAFTEELNELLPLVADMTNLSQKMLDAEQEASEIPELPGTDFRLIRRIGGGGMGQVYEALQISLDRRCAVKLLSTSLFRDAARRRQFEQESRVIAKLHHPNIVEVFSAGSTPERCFFAMELIEGKRLDQWKPSSLRELAQIGLQATRALAYAHSCGVMHRDIKPANLLLDASGKLLVSDFGIATSVTEQNGPIEDSRTGTLRYMSPERVSQGLNSYAADQYALGATLYELAADEPFLPHSTRKQLVSHIVSGNIPKLQCKDSDFAAIINRSLAFEPQDRYASMDAMAEDLEHYLNHEPVQAATPSVLHRLLLLTRRKPLAACLFLMILGCLIALFILQSIGYRQMREALSQVEQNASVADTVLQRIFSRVEEQPPSRKNSSMLSLLLPYYRTIARNKELSDQQLESAHRILGICALRDGSYPLAEKSFQNMLDLVTRASTLNLLAESQERQNKHEEAEKTRRRVITEYADSPTAEDRFEMVKALLALSHNQDDPELQQAFDVLSKLLTEHPKRPEYLLEYAKLLDSNPGFATQRTLPNVEQNPVEILLRLAEKYPQQPDYGLALTECMTKHLQNARNFRRKDWNHCEAALSIAEHLLGRWPNDPAVIEKVGRFQLGCIKAMRSQGREYRARRSIERLIAILEILSQNPEVDNDIRETLLQLRQNQEEEKKFSQPSRSTAPKRE
ncbi:MAG: protein kinase [Victivallales bacterium]|nr:protein kinase [Victivallales bacterium]